jgi:hypothetical protein
MLPPEILCNVLVDALLHADLARLLPHYDMPDPRRLRTLAEGAARLNMLDRIINLTAGAQGTPDLQTHVNVIAQKHALRCALAATITGTSRHTLTPFVGASPKNAVNPHTYPPEALFPIPYCHPEGMRALLRLSATCRALRQTLLCAPVWQTIYTLCHEWFTYAPVCLPIVQSGPGVRYSVTLELPTVPKFIRDFYDAETEGPREAAARAEVPAGILLRASHFIQLDNCIWVPRMWPAGEWFARAFFQACCRPRARAPALCGGGRSIEPTWVSIAGGRPRVFEGVPDELLYDSLAFLKQPIGRVYVNMPGDDEGSFCTLAAFLRRPESTPPTVIITVPSNPLHPPGGPLKREQAEALVPAVEQYHRCLCAEHAAKQMRKQAERDVRRAMKARERAAKRARSPENDAAPRKRRRDAH